MKTLNFYEDKYISYFITEKCISNILIVLKDLENE